MKVYASQTLTKANGSLQASEPVGIALDSFLHKKNLQRTSARNDAVKKTQVEVIKILVPEISEAPAYAETVSVLNEYLAAKEREQAILQVMRNCNRKRFHLYQQYLFHFDQLKKHPLFTHQTHKVFNDLIEHITK